MINWQNIKALLTRRNGDMYVAKVLRSYAKAGYMLCYYKNGHYYDAFTIEDPDMFSESDYIDDVCLDIVDLGVNYYDEMKKFN